MKAEVRRAFFAIAITTVLATASFAQSAHLSAEIPFDFNVGDVAMSSGKYTVKALSQTTVLIKSTESGKSVVSISDAATTPPDLKKAQLVFNRYGNRYFLSAVDWAKGLSRELPLTKIEMQTARKTGGRQRIEVSVK
jgi:hypothetical protein